MNRTCGNCRWRPDCIEGDPQSFICKHATTFTEDEHLSSFNTANIKDEGKAHNQNSTCPIWEANIGHKINKIFLSSLSILSVVLYMIGAFILIKYRHQFTIVDAGILLIVSQSFFPKGGHDE